MSQESETVFPVVDDHGNQFLTAECDLLFFREADGNDLVRKEALMGKRHPGSPAEGAEALVLGTPQFVKRKRHRPPLGRPLDTNLPPSSPAVQFGEWLGKRMPRLLRRDGA